MPLTAHGVAARLIVLAVLLALSACVASDAGVGCNPCSGDRPAEVRK